MHRGAGRRENCHRRPLHQVNGISRNRIARLNGNGSLESTTTFDPGTGANGGAFYTVALQHDGRILVGGVGFTQINGAARTSLARLNANGSVDGSFTASTDSVVYTLVVQGDGKILLGGGFTQVNGVPRNNIARLNDDGSLESAATFNPGTGADAEVRSMAAQADGKILIGGFFTSVNGATRNRISRLNANGNVEDTATFNPGTGANNGVFSVALQADGRILLGGRFSNFNGIARSFMARLSNDAAVQTLGVSDPTQVQWLRGGSMPEVSQVTIEISNNGGTTWSALGTGTWITGGWQLGGLSLPDNGLLRARGRTTGGYLNGSSSLIEQVKAFTFATSLQEWKLATLGDANALNLGDPDFDGLLTLTEYALGTLPQWPNSTPLATTRFVYPEGERLRMFVPRDPAHNDITVEVQATGDLVNGPWTALATSTLGVPFTGPGYVGGDDATLGVKTVEVRDTVGISATSQRWMRVKVTAAP